MSSPPAPACHSCEARSDNRVVEGLGVDVVVRQPSLAQRERSLPLKVNPLVVEGVRLKARAT